MHVYVPYTHVYMYMMQYIYLSIYGLVLYSFAHGYCSRACLFKLFQCVLQYCGVVCQSETTSCGFHVKIPGKDMGGTVVIWTTAQWSK